MSVLRAPSGGQTEAAAAQKSQVCLFNGYLYKYGAFTAYKWDFKINKNQ